MTLHPITLTCKDVVELVTELFDDGMPPEDRVRLEQHLLVCPPCTLHIRQVEDTLRLARELPAASLSPDTLDLFRRWKRK
jgi:hypothetical protein